MAIHGTDDRTQVTDFTTAGNSSVVAIDSLVTAPTATVSQAPNNFVGSGIQIADNFFLTAGHVVFDSGSTVGAGRVTAGANVGALPSRPSTGLFLADTNFATASISYPDNYPTAASFPRDIALVQTTGAVGATSIGMVVYLDHSDADGIGITTTGFPAALNAAGTVTTTPADPVLGWINQATLAYTSSGTISSTSADGQFGYSNSVDTEGGQSGSGVWTMIDDGTGNQVAAVVGVHTNSGNGGHLITENEYIAITNAMDGSGATSSSLPMSFIVGNDSSSFSSLPLIGGLFDDGSDIIQGSFLTERVIGLGGDDRIEGRGGDDRIEGGEGVDHVRYSGDVTEYTFTVTDSTDPNSPTVQIAHTGGSMQDGTDTVLGAEFAVFNFEDVQTRGQTGFGQDDDGTVFYVPLLADENDSTKLRDGPEIDVEQTINDTNGDLIGSMSVELPAFTFDGDISYTLNIGAESNILYNFVYIVDSSGSMSGTNITETQAAYAALTQSLIDQGVAAQSQFAVVDFDSSATLYSGLDAQGAISTVNSLVAGGGTEFGSALATAENWFESLSNIQSATNIAYFLSDGFGSGASDSLQVVNEGVQPVSVDVRAFGIGSGADTSSLSIIDSNSATILTNPSDLTDAFSVSGVDRSTIDRVDVLLNGTVVDTIATSQLVDSPLGLTFEGEIDNIPIVLGADQSVTFNLVFNDGTPSATISTRLSDGQAEVRQASPDGSSEIVTLSVTQADYVIAGTAETVNANNLNNTIEINSGTHEVFGNGGNDRFVVNAGSGVIVGGEGIDTVVFGTTLAEAGAISVSADVVSVGTSYSLLGVEFIEFSDTRLEVSTLSAVSEVSLSTDSVVVSEVDAGTTRAEFTISLSHPLTSDVVINYQTSDGTATQGADYVLSSGSVTFAAGEVSKVVSFDILDDADVEDFEQFSVDLSIVSGTAEFEGGTTNTTIAVGIENDDFEAGPSLLGTDVSGNNGDDNLVSFAGVNDLTGGGGSDYLAGGFQSDDIEGGTGNDVLRGDAGGFLGGSDVLTGGADDDFLMGGRGADTFVFSTNDGSDIIAAFDVSDLTYRPILGYSATATGADFQSGVDHIQLAGFSTVDASNVMSSVTDGADGAVFSAEGTSITFYGISANQLTTDDFIFV